MHPTLLDYAEKYLAFFAVWCVILWYSLGVGGLGPRGFFRLLRALCLLKNLFRRDFWRRTPKPQPRPEITWRQAEWEATLQNLRWVKHHRNNDYWNV